MFDNLQPTPSVPAQNPALAVPMPATAPAPIAPQPKKVEDMFAAVEKNPAQPTVNAMPTMKSPMTTNAAPIFPEEHSKKKMFSIIAIAVIIVLIAVAAGAFYFRIQSAPVTTLTPPIAENAADVSDQPAGEVPAAVENATANIDSDNDGLTDAEEATLGTSSSATDSDADGLNDYDEVKVYHTNPLNPDTDGDSFKDGQEVTNGYDPNGPGKLTVVQPSTTGVQNSNNTNSTQQ